MDHQYGVGVLNRYALLLEDDADSLDALKRQERQKDKKKKAAKGSNEKENKAKSDSNGSEGAPAAPAAPAQQSDRRKGDSPPRQRPPQSARQPPQSAEQQPNARPQGDRRAPGIRDQQQNARPQGERRDNAAAPPKGPRQQLGPQADRPVRRREDRPNGPPQQDGDPNARPRRDFGERRPNNFDRRPQDGAVDGERRPPRGGGGGGGGGGRGGGGRGGKREFDRRSGSDRTGVKPVDKREGGGSYNWGSHKDDLDEFNKSQSEGETQEGENHPEAIPTEPAGERPKEGDGDEAAKKEEEPRELTLDEWKALRASRQKPRYNLRKAGEGEDLSQWKDMVELSKPKGEGDDSDDEYESAEFPQRVGRQKHVIGIEFAFYEPRRGGTGGRGGRGRGRGARTGRGREDAQHKPKQSAPKVDDNRDFPSLG